jgi:large subunit ribosomal protein L17
MTSPGGQFAEIVQQSQEAVATAVHIWAATLRNYAAAVTRTPSALRDAQHIVDSVFDFADKVLAGQRALATSAISGGSQATRAAADGPHDRGSPVSSLVAPEDGPHGPGSHVTLPGASEAPKGFPIKGNNGSRLYHLPGSRFYNRTVAEVWFATSEAAEAAGFQLPASQR